ncbi:MAG: mechanosensitive ion channel family protein [Clostridia bacterium]|nr:mechanosensitive ion channel family protein [Clostridia bacterium]
MDVILTVIREQGIRLLGGIIVLAIGFFLTHWIMKFLTRSDKFVRIEPTLKGFLQNLLKLLLYVTVILTAAGVMGIPLTSFVTILASAGVAVSLAMQGALGNFVGGLTILLLKPFKAGDYVKIGDTEGSVQSIGVFYTELTMPDNRHISLPNSNLTNTAIVNYSRESTRRVDVVFGVGYGSDIDHVRSVLLAVANRTPGVLPDPAPTVRMTACGDSSLSFTIRVWCRTPDYWEVSWTLLEDGKRALDGAGIEIPFPQIDVHMR